MVLSHRRLRRLSRLFRRSARRAALPQALRGRGFDVTVGGVAAYSTLGHFDDPVLNTMMGWNDVELAAIIFHELTHQLLYVPNDSSFNEALATTVEEEGVRRWLLAQGRDADLASHLRAAGALCQGDRAAERDARRTARRVRLRRSPPTSMREKKRAAFAAHARLLRAALQARLGRPCSVRSLVRRRPQQCPPGVDRHLLRLRAGLRARTAGSGRQPALPFTPGSARSQNSIRPNAMPSSAARLMLGQTA